MNSTALVTTLITAIEGELPAIMSAATAATITKWIGVLEEAIPLAIEVGEELVTPIKNIIAALKQGGAVTTDQLDQLDQIEAKLDAAFDAAAAAAAAADAPASGTASAT